MTKLIFLHSSKQERVVVVVEDVEVVLVELEDVVEDDVDVVVDTQAPFTHAIVQAAEVFSALLPLQYHSVMLLPWQ